MPRQHEVCTVFAMGHAYLSCWQLRYVVLRMGTANVLLHGPKTLLLRMAC
jgi:hypothetical protein